MFFKPFADRSNSTVVCIGRWVGPVEAPYFAKLNNRDSAVRLLNDIPAKLLNQGLDVPPLQAAEYGTGEDQLKGPLVLPLQFATKPSLDTSREFCQRLAGYG